jgi:hypothetical protein
MRMVYQTLVLVRNILILKRINESDINSNVVAYTDLTGGNIMTGFFKIKALSDYNTITHEFESKHDLIINVDAIAAIESYVNTKMDPDFNKDKYLGIRIIGSNDVYVIDGYLYDTDWILTACKNAQYQNLKDALGFNHKRFSRVGYENVYEILRDIARGE